MSVTSRKNMTGERIGGLTVLGYAGSSTSGALWHCRCVCGEVVIRNGKRLRKDSQLYSLSCGCKRLGNTKHGLCKTVAYRLWAAAKNRAKRRKLAFSLEVSDIVVPDVCPVLGLKLEVNRTNRGPCNSSPSLDRIDPSKGYVPGNVRVISHRANTIKNDASADELRKVADYIDKHLRLN